MIDVKRRKFLAWRIRAKPHGEVRDVLYLMKCSPTLPNLAVMDKGYDSEPMHTSLRDIGVWSIVPSVSTAGEEDTANNSGIALIMPYIGSATWLKA